MGPTTSATLGPLRVDIADCVVDASNTQHALLALAFDRLAEDNAGEGNGRTIRIWLEDLAVEAGHQLDWTRSGHDRNNYVAIAAAHGDYEPSRALLSVVASGTTGIDRPVGVLNDLDKYLHAQAWSRTGLVHGTDQEQQVVAGQLRQLDALVVDVASYLRTHHSVRATSTEQPATERWRGLVESVHPSLTKDLHWAAFAAELDASASAGIDVAAELPRMSRAPARALTPSTGDRRTPPPAPPPPAYRVAYTPENPAAASSPPTAPPMARGGPAALRPAGFLDGHNGRRGIHPL